MYKICKIYIYKFSVIEDSKQVILELQKFLYNVWRYHVEIAGIKMICSEGGWENEKLAKVRFFWSVTNYQRIVYIYTVNIFILNK